MISQYNIILLSEDLTSSHDECKCFLSTEKSPRRRMFTFKEGKPNLIQCDEGEYKIVFLICMCVFMIDIYQWISEHS